MNDVRRGPRGRQPEVSPEAREIIARAEPLPNLERMVEVELIRKYAPCGQETEIQAVVHPGTVMRLPVTEAQRALQLGIARATNNTFRGD